MSLALGILGGITWAVGIGMAAVSDEDKARWPGVFLVLFGLAAGLASVLLW